MGMNNIRFKREQNNLITPGHDWGPAGVRVLYETEDLRYKIIKFFGHTGWSGIGMKSYFPTTYAIIHTHSGFDEKEGYCYFDILEEMEPGRKTTVAILQLQKKIDYLKKEAPK